MSGARELALAWSLADVARPSLNARARTWMCAQIGAGEYYEAIRALIEFLARHGIALPAETAQELRSWVAGYTGSDCETELRELMERIAV